MSSKASGSDRGNLRNIALKASSGRCKFNYESNLLWPLIPQELVEETGQEGQELELVGDPKIVNERDREEREGYQVDYKRAQKSPL